MFFNKAASHNTSQMALEYPAGYESLQAVECSEEDNVEDSKVHVVQINFDAFCKHVSQLIFQHTIPSFDEQLASLLVDRDGKHLEDQYKVLEMKLYIVL